MAISTRPRTTLIIVTLGREWGRVQRAFRSEAKALASHSNREIKDEVEEMAENARRRVRAMPIRGTSGKHTGLRRRVAAGVRVVGGRGDYRIITTMPVRDEAIIPRGLDSKMGWRHPVFGNQSLWVRQRPVKSGWFSEPMREGREEVQNAVEDEIEQSARRIGRAGR